MENKESYVSNYQIIEGIIGIIFFALGIFIGQNNFTIILTVWLVGVTLILLINILKDILNELRKINIKLTEKNKTSD